MKGRFIPFHELQTYLGEYYDEIRQEALRELANGYTVCIAGGAAFAMYCGMPILSDIDVFVLGKDFETSYRGDSIVDFVWRKEKTVEELLRTFPMSCEQIAVKLEKSSVSGEMSGRFVMTDEFLRAMETGQVVVDVTAFFSEEHLRKHTLKWLLRTRALVMGGDRK